MNDREGEQVTTTKQLTLEQTHARANALIRKGLRVAPARFCGERYINRDGEEVESNGKEPRGFWTKSNASTPAEVKEIFREPANILIALGECKAGRVVAIDIDGIAGQKFIDEHGILPPTLEAATGRDGGITDPHRHYFYLWPEWSDLPTSMALVTGEIDEHGKKIVAHVDVKGRNGYVIGAGSVHETLKQYRWISERPIIAAPAWLVQLIDSQRHKEKREHSNVRVLTDSEVEQARYSAWGTVALRGIVANLMNAGDGHKHEELWKAACKAGELIPHCVTHADADLALANVVRDWGKRVRSQAAAFSTIDQGLKKGMGNPRYPDDRELPTRAEIRGSMMTIDELMANIGIDDSGAVHINKAEIETSDIVGDVIGGRRQDLGLEGIGMPHPDRIMAVALDKGIARAQTSVERITEEEGGIPHDDLELPGSMVQPNGRIFVDARSVAAEKLVRQSITGEPISMGELEEAARADALKTPEQMMDEATERVIDRRAQLLAARKARDAAAADLRAAPLGDEPGNGDDAADGAVVDVDIADGADSGEPTKLGNISRDRSSVGGKDKRGRITREERRKGIVTKVRMAAAYQGTLLNAIERIGPEIAKLVRWMRNDKIPQPHLEALAIVAVGMMWAGRRVLTRDGAIVSGFVIGVSASGTGKSAALNCFDQLGLTPSMIAAANFPSVQALHKALQVATHVYGHGVTFRSPEMGKMLQSLVSQNSASHQRAVADAMLALSPMHQSGKYMFQHSVKAGEGAMETIYAPHMSIYGTTTEISLQVTLTSDASTDGSIGRCIMLPGVNGFDPEMSGGQLFREMPKDVAALHARAKKAHEAWHRPGIVGTIPTGEAVPYAPIRAGYSKTAARMLNDAAKEYSYQALEVGEGPLRTTLRRMAEQIEKVCVAFATIENPEAPMVSVEVVEAAIELIERSARFIGRLQADAVADSEMSGTLHGRALRSVTRFLQQNLGWQSTSAVGLACRGHRPQDRLAALLELHDHGHVEIGEAKSSAKARKPVRVWRWIGEVREDEENPAYDDAGAKLQKALGRALPMEQFAGDVELVDESTVHALRERSADAAMPTVRE